MAIKAVQSSLIRQVKSVGVKVESEKLKNDVIRWLSNHITNAGASGSKDKVGSKTTFNLVMFDSHSEDLPLKILEKVNKDGDIIKSIHLLESSQMNAQKQKEFATEYMKQHENGFKFEGYHASMSNILIPSKSKPIKDDFWKKIMAYEPEQKKNDKYQYVVKKKETIMFGCLPFPNQQKAMLESLNHQLMTHYLTDSVPDDAESTRRRNKGDLSYFKYGSFSLFTFLHSSQLARLLSSSQEFDLSFYSLRNRIFSLIFNTLFDVKLIDGFNGYDLTDFNPEVPYTEVKSHLKKLKEANFDENKFYPVFIAPKEVVHINYGKNSDGFYIPFKKDNGHYHDKNSEESFKNLVIEFACWMQHWDTYSFSDVLSRLLEEDKSRWQISLAAIFCDKFPLIRSSYEETLDGFISKFKEDKSETYAD